MIVILFVTSKKLSNKIRRSSNNELNPTWGNSDKYYTKFSTKMFESIVEFIIYKRLQE